MVQMVVVIRSRAIELLDVLGLLDRLVVEELGRVLVLGQWRLVQELGPLEVRRSQDVVHQVDGAVVFHCVQIASLRYARALFRSAAIVVKFVKQICPVFVAEEDDVLAVNQRVPVRHEDRVDEHESTRGHGLPQAKVPLPVGGVDGDYDARVVHLLEISLAQCSAGCRADLC